MDAVETVGTPPISPLSQDTSAPRAAAAPSSSGEKKRRKGKVKSKTKIVVTNSVSSPSGRSKRDEDKDRDNANNVSTPTSVGDSVQTFHTGSTTLPTSHQGRQRAAPALAATSTAASAESAADAAAPANTKDEGSAKPSSSTMSSWLGLGTIAEFANDIISAPDHFLSSSKTHAEGKGTGAGDGAKAEKKSQKQGGGIESGSVELDQPAMHAGKLMKDAARNSFQNVCRGVGPKVLQQQLAAPTSSSRDVPSFDETPTAGDSSKKIPTKARSKAGKGNKNKSKPPKEEDGVEEERLHPMARMRLELVKRAKAISPNRKDKEEDKANGETDADPPLGPSAEEIISDKHRKWRAKQIQIAKEEAEEMALTAERDGAADSEKEEGSQLKRKGGFNANPVQLLQKMMSHNCVTQSGFSMTSFEEDESIYGDDDDSNGSSESSDEGTSDSSYETYGTRESSQTGYTEDRSYGDGPTRDGRRSRRGRSRARDGVIYTNSSIAKKAETERRRRREKKREAENVSPEPSSTGEDLSVIGRVNGKDTVRDKSVSSEVNRGGEAQSKPFDAGGEDDALTIERNFVKAFTEKITTGGLPLIWHKVQDSNMYMQPTSIVAFIEIEESIDPASPYSEPCFHWDVVDNESQKQSTGDAPDNEKMQTKSGSIGLFDISSVEKAGVMNLHSYPFAIPGNSFFITLRNGGVILFEAKDDIEQKLVITGLRWLVARLAFNLIIGNSDICSELLNYKTADKDDATQAMNDVTNKLVEKSVLSLANRT